MSKKEKSFPAIVLTSSTHLSDTRLVVNVTYQEDPRKARLPALLKGRRRELANLSFFRYHQERIEAAHLSPDLIQSITDQFKASFLYGRKSFSVSLFYPPATP